MTDKCLICGRPVPDYIPQRCCNGIECACQGLPTNPCVCSEQCDKALFDYIGMEYSMRREMAGIPEFQEQ
jgi:hypothetical protein